MKEKTPVALGLTVQMALALALCLAPSPPPAEAYVSSPGTEAVTHWLSRHAIPLQSVEAGSGFEDLQPLRSVFKDVRIVALGEATHGSREFFQFKHRMVEFLVTQMGFTVFAIEASYPACWNINDYVLYGKGKRDEALASQGFWTWDTGEVSAMIDWMREYNRGVPEDRKVKFLGFDIQHYDQAFSVITDYLKKVAPDEVPRAEAAFEPLRSRTAQRVEHSEAKSKEAYQAEFNRLSRLFEFFTSHRSAFERRSSAQQFAKAYRHVRVLVQYYRVFIFPSAGNDDLGDSRGGRRDRFMAENVQSILDSEGPNTRMVVWAHNGHIARTSYGRGVPAMGSYLAEKHGDAYYALGFTFYEGSFQAREWKGGLGPLREFTLGAAPPESVPWYLERGRRGRPFTDYVIDVRSAPREGAVAEWFLAPLLMHSIGSVFSTDWEQKNYMAPSVLRERFDGLLFIRKTSRARPNPTGQRGEAERRD